MTLKIPLWRHKLIIIRIKIFTKEVGIMSKIINKQEAEKTAFDFFEKNFNIADAIFKGEFATNLSKILEILKIKVVIQPLNKIEEITGKTGISGLLLKDGDDYTIFLEENDSLERRRFTTSHEIAHKLLNHISDTDAVSISYRDDYAKKGNDPEEIAANAFAAALLMPEPIIRHVYTLTADISATARYLSVSDSAAKNRLINLGIL